MGVAEVEAFLPGDRARDAGRDLNGRRCAGRAPALWERAVSPCFQPSAGGGPGGLDRDRW
jgi:hypothetical protein